MMDRIPSLSLPGLSLTHPLSIPTSQSIGNHHSSHPLNSLNLHSQNLHGGVSSSSAGLHSSQTSNLHNNMGLMNTSNSNG